jgi:hypothetical protein
VAALVEDDPAGPAAGDDDLGGDRKGLVLDVQHAVLIEVAHGGEQQLAGAADQGRPAGHVRVEPLGPAVIQREHVVLGHLDQEQPLQLMQFLRLLGGQVVGWVQSVVVS